MNTRRPSHRGPSRRVASLLVLAAALSACASPVPAGDGEPLVSVTDDSKSDEMTNRRFGILTTQIADDRGDEGSVYPVDYGSSDNTAYVVNVSPVEPTPAESTPSSPGGGKETEPKKPGPNWRAQDPPPAPDIEKLVSALPKHQLALFHTLTEKGLWKPEIQKGKGGYLDVDALYPGMDPVPYAMNDLRACGALDPTPKGLYTLYAILANKHNDRPRLDKTWPIAYDHGWAGIKYEKEMAENMDLWAQLTGVQQFVRDHQEELAAAGFFQPSGRVLGPEIEARLRDMPGDERALVHIVLTKGHWKPEIQKGKGGYLDADARYPGMDPVPYAMKDLRACGALDRTPKGRYTLYVILANKHNDRPRLDKTWPITYGHGWAGIKYEKEMGENKDLWVRLTNVQRFLDENQEILTATGLLQD